MNESAGGLTQIRPSARPGGFLGEGLRAITWNRMALVHNAHRLTLKGDSLRKAAAKRQKLDDEPAN
jgi:hypothetical protein